MAEYCTVPDIEALGVNAQAIASLSSEHHKDPPIKSASDRIDSYLRSRYRLPLVAFGDDIREACAVITAWTILSVRGLKPGENPEDNALYLRYKDIIKWLERISEGKVQPDVTDSSPEQTAGGPRMGRIASNQQRGWFAEDPTRAGPFQGRRR